MALIVVSAPWEQVRMPALDLRRYLMAVVASEGVRTQDDFRVAQRGAGANMSVDIAAGLALVQGDAAAYQGYYYALNDATLNVTGFTAADGANPRVDRVVLRARDAFHGDAANDVAIVVKTGTPTSGATLINTTNAGAVGNGELVLANVLVPAGATTITTGNIDTTGALNNSPKVRPLIGVGSSSVIHTATFVDVQASVAETNILNESIAGQLLGTDKVLRCTIVANLLNNTGAGANSTFRIKLGGTTLWAATVGGGGGIATSANRRALRMQFEIANLGATNSQQMIGTFFLAAAAAPTTGRGALGVDVGSMTDAWATALGGTSTEDTTAAKNLAVSVQHSAASAQLSCQKFYAAIEIV